jgi:hypothetical protein
MHYLLSNSVNQPALQFSLEAQSEVAAARFLIQVAEVRSSLLSDRKVILVRQYSLLSSKLPRALSYNYLPLPPNSPPLPQPPRPKISVAHLHKHHLRNQNQASSDLL